ncbi:MAG: hypothetical protein JXR56_03445 [Candidatus Cloacimonetes bacterium]|nr:hypothetical protein [Candidatus Cloacimonadota bacterium]
MVEEFEEPKDSKMKDTLKLIGEWVLLLGSVWIMGLVPLVLVLIFVVPRRYKLIYFLLVVAKLIIFVIAMDRSLRSDWFITS